MPTCKHICTLVCHHPACYMREFLTFPWPSLIMWLVPSDCFRHRCWEVPARLSIQPNFWLSTLCEHRVVVVVGGGFSLCPLCSTELSPICPPLNICRGSAAPLRRGERGLWLLRNGSRNPPAGCFPPSPVGNWHIPLLIIKATRHVYSQRWADLHCRHIPQLGVSARCPFEASLCLRWLKIPSCYVFQGQ